MRDQPPSNCGLCIRRRAFAWGVIPTIVLLMGLTFLWGRDHDPPAPLALDQPIASTPASASTSEDDESLQRLWYGVVDLRHKCATEGLAGWTPFVTGEAQQRLDELNEQVWQGEADNGWSYFFARALFDIGRPTSSAPLVGFYHPWSDVWLLTEWQLEPEVKITRVELLSGEWVRRRGEPPFELRPDWLRRDGFRVEQLARATIDNLRQLESIAYGELPWRDALRLDQQQQQLDEANIPAVSLQLFDAWLRAEELALGADAFDQDHPPPPVLEQLVASSDRFLDSGRRGGAAFFVELATSTNPQTAALIRQLSADAYDQLVPVYWLADEQWVEAFLVPDHNPDFCLALTYKRVSSRLQLTRVDLVHFPTIANTLGKEVTK